MPDRQRKLNPSEGVQVKLAARVLRNHGEETIADMLTLWANHRGSPEPCEGCSAPATHLDADGVPLCKTCMSAQDARAIKAIDKAI